MRPLQANSLQYSCLENPIGRGAWQATVHGVSESDTTEVTKHARIYNLRTAGTHQKLKGGKKDSSLGFQRGPGLLTP